MSRIIIGACLAAKIASANSLPPQTTIPNGAGIYSASVEKCHFSKKPLDSTGVYFVRDTVSNDVYYKYIKNGNVIRFEKLDPLDALRLLQRIDSIDFRKLDFGAKYEAAQLARAKRENRLTTRTDGCFESIAVQRKTDTLNIKAWNLLWKIDQSREDDDQIRRVYNLNREAYAIVGRYEILMLSN